MQNTMTISSQNMALTKRIMRRVYFHWFLRQIAPVLALQLGALGLLLIGIHEYVSVKFVSANALSAISDIQSLYSFAVTAFWKTELVSRVLVGASVLFALLLGRDILRFWSRTLRGSSARMAAMQSDTSFR